MMVRGCCFASLASNPLGCCQAETHSKKVWRCYLKRVANSYSAKDRSTQAVAVRSRALPAGTRTASRTSVKSWIPHIPNYVWLAMIVLAFTALSVSTYRRAQDAEAEALQSHAVVSSR